MATTKHHPTKGDNRTQHSPTKSKTAAHEGKTEEVIPGGQGRVKNPKTDRRLKQNRA